MATGKAAERGAGFLALLRAGDVRAALTRHADLALAVLVVAMVGMMIVPLPTPLLDLLISLNIAGAVVLLLVSLYVGDALRIATFPTLLLLTTLFRLAIEVSATRLVLLRADAGEVIRAFGGFVVAGNLVVGAVVFLILTVVQFVVISKGAERVAEVGARFALDAMPGRQLSIDAELRAGHIDAAEARDGRFRRAVHASDEPLRAAIAASRAGITARSFGRSAARLLASTRSIGSTFTTRPGTRATSIAAAYSESKSRRPSHLMTTSMSSRPGPENSGGLFLQTKAAPTFRAASASPG